MTLELKCGVVQGEERDPGLRLQQEFCFKDRLVRRGSQAPARWGRACHHFWAPDAREFRGK